MTEPPSLKKAVVRGFAKAVPTRKVTNHDLTQWMDTSDQWIVQRSGIKTRYWVEAPTTTSDLAAESCAASLELAGSREVDAIVAATLSPDHFFPGIGVQVQAKLSMPTVPAFDIRDQCCGFVYALEMAAALVSCGQYKRILVVGAEVHSTALDISTRGRDIAVLFGDGAGSCLVERAEHYSTAAPQAFEVLGSEMHSDGNYVEELWCKHPGSAHFPVWITDELVAQAEIFPKMNGRHVFEHAIKRMSEVSLSLLAAKGMTIDDVAIFLPHQANLRISQMVGKMIGIQPEKVFNTIEKYGNTTAATIPIGMTEALGQERIKSGDIVLMAAFGSGFTWGAVLLRAL